ncbi:MAG: VanZ family protein [Phycisphaeraceae bacterium JB051]
MQNVLSLTVRYHRWIAAVIAVTGFGILYLAAKLFAGDLDIAFLTDHQVRVICHFSGYGCLAVFVHAALRRNIWLSWTIALALAWGEEFHQLFVPGRYFTWDDLLVNFLGVSIFLLLAHKLRLIQRVGRLLGNFKVQQTATA